MAAATFSRLLPPCWHAASTPCLHSFGLPVHAPFCPTWYAGCPTRHALVMPLVMPANRRSAALPPACAVLFRHRLQPQRHARRVRAAEGVGARRPAVQPENGAGGSCPLAGHGPGVPAGWLAGWPQLLLASCRHPIWGPGTAPVKIRCREPSTRCFAAAQSTCRCLPPRPRLMAAALMAAALLVCLVVGHDAAA